MSDDELKAVSEQIRKLIDQQSKHAWGSLKYEAIDDEIRSRVGETDGKAQRFVDAYERVIH